MNKYVRYSLPLTIVGLCLSTNALANDRNKSIEAGATFVGDQTLATFGYSHELSNNIVTGGGFSIGTDTIDGLPEPNEQDAWGLHANVGYKFEIGEFDIIPKVGINYLNADVKFNDAQHNDFNLDNVYASVGGTVNWRMLGLSVDYGKLSDNYNYDGNNVEFDEDVVRVTASFNF
ncbi:hypothetical protein L4C54_23070 [Vibrio lamellibrachiae]|uniref:hypothetical protein n=1 Tax=Vibrio lamellibrachiae TaxID=2910253 RepID=UPI003D1428DB